jgi:phage/plasmid-associated DNA primase
MIGYTDSDWAGNTKDRKSMGAYVFCIGNTAISWQSKKQEITAVSTQEAEYMAYLEAGREAVWLRLLYTDITTRMKNSETSIPTTTILSDNQGALVTVKNGVYKARTKHIDVKYHRARDFQNSGEINYSYVNTKDNLADVLTKALPTSTHERLISKMGLCGKEGHVKFAYG